MPFHAMYRAALRLYPADYRVRFGSEMRAAFDAAALETRPRGGREYLCFALIELMALTAGACREWIVKLFSDPTARARTLPDCRLMRPVGISRSEWIAGLDDGA